MDMTINTKTLRADMARVVRAARQGQRFTVLYRSRVAFDIVPAGSGTDAPGRLADDPVYRAPPLGSSSDGRAALDHDGALYA